MKRDLKLLTAEVEKKIGVSVHVQSDWEKIMDVFRKHHYSFKKLSPTTLNHLALLAGYQNWKDLQEALHGETDGEINYETKDEE
jgi:hypothetical protein